MAEPPHLLKTLLQLQLATDTSAVLHIPWIVPALSPACFTPSPHLQKWTTRTNSLIHSKDPGARWAGLVLALQTAVYSREVMMENAQGWMGVALPLLSKAEPLPNLKAAIRLLCHVFSAATDIPEFQRQLATPNVPKFSLAVLALADKHHDRELQILSINTLTHIIPLFPTLHRALHTQLSAFCLRSLNGAAPTPTDSKFLEACSRLYAVLPVTGGKVGAAALWRKSVDETVAFTWTALAALRTTFPLEGLGKVAQQFQQLSNEDPLVNVPLNVDRLRCGVAALSNLLKFSHSRPVTVPVGSLVQLSVALLGCTNEDQRDGHVDVATRTMEESITPDICRLGCELLINMSSCSKRHLSAHVPRIMAIVTYHLEQPLTPTQRLPFLRFATTILQSTLPLHHPITPTRLTKALLSIISVLLPNQSDIFTDSSAGSAGTGSTKSKKGKKRARTYEGDEVFKIASEVTCQSDVEGEVLLEALDALKLILHDPSVSPTTHSIASRVLLSINLSLPLVAPSHLSPDLTLYTYVREKIQKLCLDLGTGTSSAMSKSLNLVLNSGDLSHLDGAQRTIDLLLHPRVPPLVRTLPHVETLSLFKAEESNEEIEARTALNIGSMTDSLSAAAPSIAMQDEQASVSAPALSWGLNHTVQRTDQGLRTSFSTGVPVPFADTAPPVAHSSSTTTTATMTPSTPMGSTNISSLPPPPEPFPSVSSTSLQKPSTSISYSSGPVVTPAVASGSGSGGSVGKNFAPMDEDDDDDEPMPTINMDSDSD